MGRNGYTSWADNQWIGGCNSPTWGETKGNIRTLVRKMEYNSDNLEANQEMLRDHSDRLHYVHSIQSNKQRPMCVI